MNYSEDGSYSIDYLSLTVFLETPEDEDRYLKRFGLLDLVHDTGHGGRSYRRMFTSPIELNIYREPTVIGKSGRHMHIEFKGTSCRHFGMDYFEGICSILLSDYVKFKITRSDFAVDHQRFTAAELWEKIELDKLGEVGIVSSYVKRDFMTRFNGLNEDINYSVYVGSANSVRRINCYQKVFAPGEYHDPHPVFGREVFNRVELRLRDNQAHGAVLALLGLDRESWFSYISGLIRGFFDVDVEWWQGLFSAEKIKGFTRQVQSTIQGIANWLHTQVLPALATYIEAVSPKGLEDIYLRDLLEQGRKGMKRKHYELAQSFDQNLRSRYCPIHF